MRASARHLTLIALPGIPRVEPGDDLVTLILEAAARLGETLSHGDILVVAQKVVSKAEGRQVDLCDVEVSPRARRLAVEVEKDPRLVELILSESTEVVRHCPGVLVVAHRLGIVLANAGIDRSNVAPGSTGERVLLLPIDPDGTAAQMRAEIVRRAKATVSIVISDSVGRAWRRGTVGIALGSAGLPALLDLRGRKDLWGRALAVTEVGLGDEIAAAASLLMGQADEAAPVVLVRGLDVESRPHPDGARALLREKEADLFR